MLQKLSSRSQSFLGNAYLYLALVAALLFLTSLAYGQQQTGARISVPSQVEVETPIEIQFDLSNSKGIAGYELLVEYDKAVAEFAGAYLGDVDSESTGRELIIADQVEPGVALVVFTCQIAGCKDDHGIDLALDGSVTPEPLDQLTLRLLPSQAGELTINIVATKFVDSQGNQILVDNLAQQVEISVTDSSRSAVEKFEPSVTGWTLEEQKSAEKESNAPTKLSIAELDHSNDGRVSFIDAVEAILAWKQVRNSNSVCDLAGSSDIARFDLNNDGCLDIADIQPIASFASSEPVVRNSGRNAEIVFTVTTTSDEADNSFGDGLCTTPSGGCSLRAAVMESNAQAGPNSIHFNIPGAGVQQIQLTDSLPTVNDESGGLTIDGYTQPGATVNTDPLASNANILIEIRGSSTTNHTGLTFITADNVVRGLAMYDLYSPIILFEDNAQRNQILGNYIGTNAAGDAQTRRISGAWSGVRVIQGAKFNVIGLPNLADRNVISGNDAHGIRMDHNGTNANTVQNNIFGLNPTGTDNLGNNNNGMDIQWGPSQNLIGGMGQYERNVFSGNGVAGFDFSHSQSTSNNHLVGNFLGTDLTGTQGFSWTQNKQGIIFKDDPINNYVYENVISGNREDGIWHKHNYTGRNYIFNNKIGTGADGSVIGNGKNGMFLTGHDFEIGPNNVFAGNTQHGIAITNYQGGGANEPSSDSYGNHIFQNSFFDNGGLAIDINSDGVTSNDANDLDTGPNGVLNFPIITSVSETNVSGTACANCKVEIYWTDAGPGTHGEGKFYLGETTTNGSGAFSLNMSLEPGTELTAIAIDQIENTSEFSENVTVPGAGSLVTLETLAISNVDENWTSVAFANSYQSPVVACSSTYANNSIPFVIRMDQLTGSGFNIRLQNPSDLTTLNGESITCLAVEEGAWTLPNGAFIEAQKFDSTTTASKSVGWVGESQTYLQTYTDPIILGQVMSFNDPDWSTYWSSGSDRTVGPNSSVLNLGLHVGEDTDTTRAAETIGFIVIEASSGSIDGSNYQAYQSTKIVEGITESPPYTSQFPSAFASNPAGAVVSQAGMAGADGTWMLLVGNSALSQTEIDLAVDEDQISDSERVHTTELANIFVFESPFSVQGSNASPATPTPTPTATPVPPATPTPTPSPTPENPTGPVLVAQDSFSRNQAPGWGTAEIGGGYTHLWGATASNDFSVNGSAGELNLNSAGVAREALLNQVSVLDSTAEYTFSVDKIPSANSYIRILTRQMGTSTSYRAVLQVSSAGVVEAYVDRLANGSWGRVSNNQALGLQLAANTDYQFKVQTMGTNPTTISLKVWESGSSEPANWQHVATDSTPALQNPGGVGIRVNLSGGVSNTPIQVTFDDFEVYDVSVPTVPTGSGRLETVSASADGNWTTVNTSQTYDSPVIACSVSYVNNTNPVVIRMQNVASNSFDVRLQNPGDLASVVSDQVSCLVAEEGTWTLPDGRKMEAQLVNSTITDNSSSWVGQSVAYGQTYANPTVFGQVMTSNDAKWSTFWSRGSSAISPASPTSLFVGKEVAEDPDTNRANETLGVIIIDAGQGTLDSVNYETITGPDTVFDISNPATYTFNSSFGSTPQFGLVTQAAMDGGNGGWAYLFGSNGLTASGLTLIIDEDQINDSERAHTNEQVSYFVAESPLSISWGDDGPDPEPTPVPVEVYAQDDFNRTISESWSFGNIGGIYEMLWGTNANDSFLVNGNEGEVFLNPNQSREANLEKVISEDFDIRFKVKVDNLSGSNLDTFASGRIIDSGSLYRLRIRIQPSGFVQASMIKAANGSWTVSQTATIAGLNYQANDELNVRYQIVGTNPTTLRVKVWEEGNSEPAGWNISITDNDSVLQTSGSFGLKFLHNNGGSGPVNFIVDDLLVTNVEFPPANRFSLPEANWESTRSQGMSIYLPAVNNQSQLNEPNPNLGEQQDNK